MGPELGGASDVLLDRARRGDARAFEQLALEIERPLYRHAARMVGHDDAEDVVQDALLSAWKSLASFEGTSFRAWVFRIVTNRALYRLRSRRRHPELPLDPPAKMTTRRVGPSPRRQAPSSPISRRIAKRCPSWRRRLRTYPLTSARRCCCGTSKVSRTRRS